MMALKRTVLIIFFTKFHFPLEKNIQSLKTSALLSVTNQCALYKWLCFIHFFPLAWIRFLSFSLPPVLGFCDHPPYKPTYFNPVDGSSMFL
jgi:hypothetical protein